MRLHLGLSARHDVAGRGGDLLLIGSDAPSRRGSATLRVAWQRPRVAADLETVGVAEPFAILSMFLTGDEGAARFGANVPLQSDDRMALDFLDRERCGRPSGATRRSLQFDRRIQSTPELSPARGRQRAATRSRRADDAGAGRGIRAGL